MILISKVNMIRMMMKRMEIMTLFWLGLNMTDAVLVEEGGGPTLLLPLDILGGLAGYLVQMPSSVSANLDSSASCIEVCKEVAGNQTIN